MTSAWEGFLPPQQETDMWTGQNSLRRASSRYFSLIRTPGRSPLRAWTKPSDIPLLSCISAHKGARLMKASALYAHPE